LVRDGLVRAGLLQAGLGWAGLLRATAGTVLGWTEFVEGHDGQEATMLRLDCVSFEFGLLISHKPDHDLLIFSLISIYQSA